MKVGDLVIRKVLHLPDWKLKPAMEQRERLGHGLVLSKSMGGKPVHPIVTVYYATVQETWDIAESLVEVVNGKE